MQIKAVKSERGRPNNYPKKKLRSNNKRTMLIAVNHHLFRANTVSLFHSFLLFFLHSPFEMVWITCKLIFLPLFLFLAVCFTRAFALIWLRFCSSDFLSCFAHSHFIALAATLLAWGDLHLLSRTFSNFYGHRPKSLRTERAIKFAEGSCLN